MELKNKKRLVYSSGSESPSSASAAGSAPTIASSGTVSSDIAVSDSLEAFFFGVSFRSYDFLQLFILIGVLFDVYLVIYVLHCL